MFMKETKGFPGTFLFGAATSAFQLEGNRNKKKRGISVLDNFTKDADIADFSVASDHYNRLEEDVALMKELGLEAYRFSISWVSIMPDGKKINEEGFHFYDKLIRLLKDNHIEPIVTIYHFEYPKSLVDKYGGWVSPESIDDYLHLAKLLFERYKESVRYWISINEQDHVVKVPHRLGLSTEITGLDYENLAQKANLHMTIASAKAIKLCHEIIPNGKIGPAINPIIALPGTSNPADVAASIEFEELTYYYMTDTYYYGCYSPIYIKYLSDRGIENPFKKEVSTFIQKHRPDFFGINYYMTQTVVSNRDTALELRGPFVIKEKETGIYQTVQNNFLKENEWNWEIAPEGLKLAVMRIYSRYKLPVLITENGLGAIDTLNDGKITDTYRIDYLKRHLLQLRDCVDAGYPVIGYCPWSFIDLVSGHNGMNKRYGFVYVDRTDKDIKEMKRIKKDSFYWYQQTIKDRGRKN